MLISPGPTTPRATSEFRLEEAAQATGHAYVRYRDGATFRAVALIPATSIVYVGRDERCVVLVAHDGLVSRRHARLIFGGGQWSLQDGPSRNGTFIGGERIVGEVKLADHGEFTVGTTVISFHHPDPAAMLTTLQAEPPVRLLSPNATQRKILVELARPFLERREPIAATPGNPAIAAALGYQTVTIRDAISALYAQAKLTRKDTPDRRTELVRLAIREGVLQPSDYD